MKRNALTWVAIVLSTAALISSRGVTRAVPAAPQISVEGQKQARALGDAFNAVAEFVKPSVVQISVEHKAKPGGNLNFPPRNGRGANPHENIDPQDMEEMLRRFLGPQGPFQKQQLDGPGTTRGTGSGFIYDDQGHIVTNNHVVEGADKITVSFYDGEEAIAKVVGTDPKSDVAVIKVETLRYRPLPKGKSSKARVGDWVLAIGSPFGFEQSVTSGIISAVGRNDNHILGRDTYEDFLQTDAAINPGNSGGPLVDLDGKVIGINAAIATSSRSNSGIGFAIPIDMAANLADRLIKDGKITRGLLGIGMQNLSMALARDLGLDPKTKGVLVDEVLNGSPAAKAGLQNGDLLTSFDGKPALNRESFRNMVSTSEIGKEFALTYLREGKEFTAKVTLVPADELLSNAPTTIRRPNQDPKKFDLAGFGLEVQELTPELAKQFGFADDVKGVVISNVLTDSSAEANGLQPGMLITKVYSKDRKATSVTSAKQFQEIAAQAHELTVYAQEAQGRGRFYSLAKPSK